MANSIVLAWSKCTIKVGNTGNNDAMADSLTSIGTIKDKSSVLESADGDTLEMKETGGAIVGYEVGEGSMTLKTRVIEPGSDFYTLFGNGTTSNNTISVKSHLVDHEVSVKVIPNKVNAYGINAPKCTCTAKFGWSEEDGNYCDLTFGIIKSVTLGYWYQRFKVAENDFTESAGSSENAGG